MKILVTLAIVCALALPAGASAKEQSFNFTVNLGSVETALTLPFDVIHSIVPIDLGGDGTSELLLGSPPGFIGKVFLIRLDGSIINSWTAYNEQFTGGVNVAAGDLDEDGRPEIITAPAGGGGPHVRIFDGYGNPKISPGFFASENSYRGSVEVGVQRLSDSEPLSITTITNIQHQNIFTAYTPSGTLIKSYPLLNEPNTSVNTVSISIQEQGTGTTLELPRATKAIERDGKIIIIDLSDQTLSYYEDGYRIETFPNSTGKPGYETPLGEHIINNKAERAFSARYGLYMPYWMSFIGGLYGIHELPYWPNGYREGEDHLGIPVSHGCVRLGMGPAEKLYRWAEVGTPVIVQP